MRPEGSEYSKEVTVQEASSAYERGELMLLDFIMVVIGTPLIVIVKQIPVMNSMEDITLNMLLDIRYFVKGDSNDG